MSLDLLKYKSGSDVVKLLEIVAVTAGILYGICACDNPQTEQQTNELDSMKSSISPKRAEPLRYIGYDGIPHSKIVKLPSLSGGNNTNGNEKKKNDIHGDE